MRVARFLLGLTAGAAIGAGVALLLAPASGNETKATLKEATDQAIRKAKDIEQKSRSYIESERTHLQEAIEAGKQAAQEKRIELEQEIRFAT